MSVKTLIADPEFDKLAPEEKQQVLASVDPDFKNIGVNEVNSVIDGIREPKKEVLQQLKNRDPLQFISQAAPSNVFKLMGVGSVNAPGVAGAAINSLPGIGDPSQIIPSLQNIKKNPGQMLQALKRISQVNEGGGLTQQEKAPAIAGEALGTGLEMMTPDLMEGAVKASSPFMAGFKAPRTALIPGAMAKAGEELGAERLAARALDDAGEARRLRIMVKKNPSALAEEGKQAIEAGKDLTVTQLENYGEALGKMQGKGGVNANEYAKPLKMAREMLQWKAPELVNKIEESALHYAAKGDPTKLPWIIGALNPKVAALKMATMPAVQNIAGGLLSPLSSHPGSVASLANGAGKIIKDIKLKPVLGKTANQPSIAEVEAPKKDVGQQVTVSKPDIQPMKRKLTKGKAKEYLKQASGNRDKAREMAKSEGWEL